MGVKMFKVGSHAVNAGLASANLAMAFGAALGSLGM